MFFTCAWAWLCSVIMVPLMLFIWALDTKKTELTAIEIMHGISEKIAHITS